MTEREYTVISDKRDWDNNINYAIMYYWENGVRKIEQKEIIYNYFYALPGVNWDHSKFRVLKGFTNVYGNQVNKIIPKENLSIDQYKEIKAEHEGQLCESDVRAVDRFLWEEKPKFSKHIRTWYLDIEILRNKDGQYSSVDEATNKVTAITLYDNVLRKYYVLLLTDDVEKRTKTEIGDRIIYKFRDERNLLDAFIQLVEKLDPDCFTGWNVMGFDMPYLLYRMDNLNIEYRRISPLFNVKFGRRGGNFTSYVTYSVYIKGRVIMDLMDISKLFWLGTDVGYSLEAQSRKYLNDGKIKIGDIDKAYREDFERFVEYNVKDVTLCIDLDKENKLISNMQSFQDVISINLNETPVAGRTINSYIKQHTNIILDNSHPKPVERIPGGYVVPTAKGIYDNVIKFDFASHYPSFIRTYNVSPDTVVHDPTEEEKKNLIHFYCWYEWGDEKSGSSGAVVMLNPTEAEKKRLEYFEVYFRKDKRGIITKIVDELTDMRLKYKKEKNTSLSTVYKRMINCFSGDHDVLTPNGIKNIKDFKIGDDIYTLNPDTQEAELDKVKRVYEYDYKGEMYEFKNRGVDFFVTPNHRIYHKIHYNCKDFGNIKYKEAKDIFKQGLFNLPDNVKMPDTNYTGKIDLVKFWNKTDLDCNNYFIRIGNSIKKIPRYYNSDHFLKFLGWFISEGSLQHIKISNSYVVTINQSRKINPDKCRELEKLLDMMGLEWKIYDDNKTYKITSEFLYKFLEKYCGKGSYNKKIPKWCFDFSNHDLRELYKSLMLGDGDKTGFRYTTKSEQLANDFLYLCLRIGKVAKMYKQQPCNTYRIRIRDNPVCSISRRDKTIIPYDGKVYCIECEKNHIIMVGRNNKLRWCGQSVYGQFIYKYSRFFNNSCGKVITLGCQTLTKGVIDLIGYRNIAEVLMGDTDSFCAKMFKGHDTKELLETMELIFENCCKKYNLSTETNYSKLELEDEIDKMILFGVKKKYVEKIGEEQKVIGLELIRKDFPLALKEFQQKSIDYIFDNHRPTLTGLREIKRDIQDKIRTKIMLKEYEYFAMPTVIRKHIDEYVTETAEKKSLRNSGLKISINETFFILPCVGNNDLAFKSIEDLKKLSYKPDYDRIVGKVFGNVGIWESLFIKQAKLGDFDG